MNCCKESTGILHKYPTKRAKKWMMECYICRQTTKLYTTKEEATKRWKEITDASLGTKR